MPVSGSVWFTVLSKGTQLKLKFMPTFSTPPHLRPPLTSGRSSSQTFLIQTQIFREALVIFFNFCMIQKTRMMKSVQKKTGKIKALYCINIDNK